MTPPCGTANDPAKITCLWHGGAFRAGADCARPERDLAQRLVTWITSDRLVALPRISVAEDGGARRPKITAEGTSSEDVSGCWRHRRFTDLARRRGPEGH